MQNKYLLFWNSWFRTFRIFPPSKIWLTCLDGLKSACRLKMLTHVNGRSCYNLTWQAQNNLIGWKFIIIPDSGSELRSPQSNRGMLLQSGKDARGLRLVWESSIMVLSSVISIIVWISFTSLNSGSQWMWHVATNRGWREWPSGGTPETTTTQSELVNSSIVIYTVFEDKYKYTSRNVVLVGKMAKYYDLLLNIKLTFAGIYPQSEHANLSLCEKSCSLQMLPYSRLLCQKCYMGALKYFNNLQQSDG